MPENLNYTTHIYAKMTVNGRKRFVQEITNHHALVIIDGKLEKLPVSKINKKELSELFD
jgi:hypothetical protein